MKKEKIILPKNVAEAIERIKRGKDDSDDILLNYPTIANHANSHPDYRTINDYIKREGKRKYLSAMINGYIKDKSPEEKLKERYKYYVSNGLMVSANAIKETLILLNKRVEGIS